MSECGCFADCITAIVKHCPLHAAAPELLLAAKHLRQITLHGFPASGCGEIDKFVNETIDKAEAKS